jgi:tyrosine-protein phosphatase YwqE
MVFPGMVFSGTRDSMVAMTHKYRGYYQAVTSKVEAVMSVRSKDQNQDWALIWGSEITTTKDGKVDSAHIHEAWHFNKDGKVAYMSQ